MKLVNQQSKVTKNGIEEVTFDVIRESVDKKKPANVVIGSITIKCTQMTLEIFPSLELSKRLNFHDNR